MNKRTFAILFAAVFAGYSCPLFAEDALVSAPAAAQEPLTGMTVEHQEVVKPQLHVSQDDLTKQAIRERVRALRQERMLTMPYLERSYVRQAIDAKKVQDKMKFVEGGEKKLQDLVGRAIQSHTAAQAAKERISLANRRILVAMRKLFPEASMELEYKRGTLSGQAFNGQDYKFVLRQPIFRGGILWNTLLQERAELKAAQKEYEKIIEDVVRDVSKAYFEYSRAKQVADDRLEAITRMERFDTISEQKFKEELISEIEHLNVQSLFSQMKYDYETSKQELELAKLDLQSYLDIDNEDNIQTATIYDMNALVEKAAVENTAPTSPETASADAVAVPEIPDLKSLVDMAYGHRAELQVESAKLASAQLKQRIRMGELLPKADIVMEMGELGEAFNVDAIHPKQRNEYRLMLELTWNAAGNTIKYEHEDDQNAPSVTQFQSSSGSVTKRNKMTLGLLDGLDALADAKEAEAQKLDQIVALENAEKEVIQDVKQAYYDYQKASIQVKSSLQRLNYRQRLAELSKHRLEQNEIQISEYMQAEIDAISERAELHKALNEYFTAKANLNRAVGIRNYMPIEESYGNK